MISSQRSGLNFLRVCIESLTGQRTPGKTLLIEAGPDNPAIFFRTHDAAQISQNNAAVWRGIDAQTAQGRKIVLLIRNPFEIFGRELKNSDRSKAVWALEVYASNLNHFCTLENCTKSHFYYEDFTADPQHMIKLIEFMDIDNADGQRVTRDILMREWDRVQEIGRNLYDINQKKQGGCMSRNARDKMSFHQSILSKSDNQTVIRFLDETVSAAGKTILDRYISSIKHPKKTLTNRVCLTISSLFNLNSMIRKNSRNDRSKPAKSN